jgi:hypothetical protein
LGDSLKPLAITQSREGIMGPRAVPSAPLLYPKEVLTKEDSLPQKKTKDKDKKRLKKTKKRQKKTKKTKKTKKRQKSRKKRFFSAFSPRRNEQLKHDDGKIRQPGRQKRTDKVGTYIIRQIRKKRSLIKTNHDN